MIRTAPRYAKLKTYLNLASNRLKLLQVKKSQYIYKEHRSIQDYLEKKKFELAKSKFLNVLMETASLESMELTEMLCHQLLSSMGKFKDCKELDKVMHATVTSLLWVTPYIAYKVPEMKTISKQLTANCGRSYRTAAIENKNGMVCPELIQKIQFEMGSENLTSEFLKRKLRKYDVPEHRKEAFELFCMKTNSADSSSVLSKEEHVSNKECTPSASDVILKTEKGKFCENCVKPPTTITWGKVDVNRQIKSKPFTGWIRKFIPVKSKSNNSEGEDNTSDIQEDIYSDFGKGSKIFFSQNIPEYVVDQPENFEKNNKDSILNDHTKAYNFDRGTEEQPNRSRHSITDLTDLNTLNSNCLETADNLTEVGMEIRNSSQLSCKNKCNNDSSIANYAAVSTEGNKRPSDLNEPPPKYDEINFGTNGRFYHQDDDHFLYPPLLYLPSPPPSCPSDDDMHPDE